MKQIIKKHHLLLALIGVLLIGVLSSKSFLAKSNIQSFMIIISIYGFLALGQAIVMFVSEINLTLGAQMAFAPIASVWVTRMIYAHKGVPFIQGNIYIVNGLPYLVLFTVLFGLVVGLVNGLLRVLFNVHSLIITLGMMYVLAGACYVLAGQYNMFLSNLNHVAVLGSGKIGFFPICFILFLLVGALLTGLMKYTTFGLRLYATGGNEKAAMYSGINTKFWKVLSFCLSGLFASTAALIYSSRMESIDPLQGSSLLFFTIAIAVIGGVHMLGGSGTIPGTMMGAVILALSINIMQMSGIASWYQTIIVGIIITIAAAQQMKTDLAA